MRRIYAIAFRVPFCSILATVAIIPWSMPACAAENQETSEMSGGIMTRDAHAFETAQEMYDVAANMPHDSKCDQLAAAVRNQLTSGKTIESRNVWPLLISLNPYRRTPEVQAEVNGWVELAISRIRRAKSEKANHEELFRRAGEQYKAKQFAEASKTYGNLLWRCPLRPDVRNNLALAQMHLGNDLIAEVELLIARNLDQAYVPPLVNLTVVFERLGLRDRAKQTAELAARSRQDLPEAVFNTEWYGSLAPWAWRSGKLAPFIKQGMGPKYKTLYDIRIEQSRVKGVWGVWGSDGAWWKRLVAVPVFGLVSLFIASYAAACGQRTFGRSKARKAFLTFLVLGTLAYILAWGVPVGAWWLGPAAYILFFGGTAASAARMPPRKRV